MGHVVRGGYGQGVEVCEREKCMKAVILAGGIGSRLSEETQVKPKPLVEIGGKPILWHIMKIYGAHGIRDFVICCGYRGHQIKDYFANYFLHQADLRFDLRTNRMEVLRNCVEDWSVTVVDTGEHTMTGGRLKRVRDYLGDGTFCMTYGDGVGDVDLAAAIQFHRSQGVLATVTAAQPPGRFGALALSAEPASHVSEFIEKPGGDGMWVNAGFFVLEPAVLDYVEGDSTVWEKQPLEALARAGSLAAYRHQGFWQPMDGLRDKVILEELWNTGKAPWKIW
jgi:glucose-1-phosphate cytidylyltransferase